MSASITWLTWHDLPHTKLRAPRFSPWKQHRSILNLDLESTKRDPISLSVSYFYLKFSNILIPLVFGKSGFNMNLVITFHFVLLFDKLGHMYFSILVFVLTLLYSKSISQNQIYQNSTLNPHQNISKFYYKKCFIIIIVKYIKILL